MGQGSLWKRGGVWWIRYSVNGRRYNESTKTHRKEAAQALLRERTQAIWEGRFFPGKQKRTEMTVGALRDMWLKEKATKRDISHDKQRLASAVDFFEEHRLISTLEADDISAWRDSLADEFAPATVNRYLAVLRSALNLADARGHGHQNPMKGIELAQERGERDRICSTEEYDKLVEEADQELKVLITIGYWTGMRLGEIVNLTWDRIDLKGRTFRLAAADTKESAAKAIPLPAEAVELMEALPRNLSGRVFGSTTNWYSHEFTRLCRAAGIEGLHFHDLRHTAATNMRRAGLDLLTIKNITGHKTMQMLERYSHVTDDDLRTAMTKVQRHAAGRERSKR